MFKKLFFILVFIGLGPHGSFAMDLKEDGDLPQGYQHFPLRQQIQRYQTVFDPIMQDFPQTFNDAPAPGLFPILKNGLAYLHDYILEDEKRTNIQKKPFIDSLQAIWGHAQTIDSFTPRRFNMYMDYLVSHASNFKNDNECRTPEKIVEALNISLNNKTFWVYSRPTFSLCLNPKPNVSKRGISSKTEVDIFFGHTYGAYLLSFDLLLSENIFGENSNLIEEGLPHSGRFNGTAEMYDHDEGHAERVDRDINENAYKLLKKIYNISQSYEERGMHRNNKILIDGLHLLFHEVLPYAIGKEGNYKSEEVADLLQLDEFTKAPITKEVCSHFIQTLSHYMTGELFRKRPFDQLGYIVTPLDWEFVLATNEDEEGTLLITKENRREETVKEGYRRFWNYFNSFVLEKWDDIH